MYRVSCHGVLSAKTRASPLVLLKQFVTLTGRKIRYLRIDGAKEFQSDEIKKNCAENDLQLVLAYNHTVVRCKPAWRVQLATSNSTDERLQICYTLTSPPVSGMTRPKIPA